MINDSAGIVENALLEASLRRIRLIESMDYPDIVTDEEYDNRILDVIYGRTKEKKRLPKRIALILVAALTICFLIVFTVSAQVRTAVVDFFVEIYETFASFFIENNNVDEKSKSIEIKYEPSYFQNNSYTKINETISSLRAFSVWSNHDFTIEFSQYVSKNSDITLDAEKTSYEITYIGNQKVYFTIKNNIYFIKWLTYGYSFNLSCDTSLDWEEIEKIITSLEPVTE
ncbi:MAG: DUF4367 domain-containing protein [Clostridia bacterium]|nr:DUF4367 domain-containing protein [Clostridia bacterium]